MGLVKDKRGKLFVQTDEGIAAADGLNQQMAGYSVKAVEDFGLGMLFPANHIQGVELL